MLNPIKEIVRFNDEAGLTERGYKDSLESAFQIEEALEGFDLKWLIRDLNDDHLDERTSTAKDVSRSIISSVTETSVDIPDVDRLDKACDAVVFAVGSMRKLGLDAQQITRALNIVMKANFQKLGAPKDEHGKQLKPEGWTGPEPELQKILDERT